jgi:hypothetical protein
MSANRETSDSNLTLSLDIHRASNKHAIRAIARPARALGAAIQYPAQAADICPIEEKGMAAVRLFLFGEPGIALIMGVTLSGCVGASDFPQDGPLSSGAAIDKEARALTTRVAITAACAQKYGLAVEPTKLKASYLRYEGSQGATRAQLVDTESSYDAAYDAATAVCPAGDGAEIKADLLRYQAGYFTPRTPLPAPKFDVKTVWDMQD